MREQRRFRGNVKVVNILILKQTINVENVMLQKVIGNVVNVIL